MRGTKMLASGYLAVLRFSIDGYPRRLRARSSDEPPPPTGRRAQLQLRLLGGCGFDHRECSITRRWQSALVAFLFASSGQTRRCSVLHAVLIVAGLTQWS
jgi:hypothetical protein